ncbi:MAG: toprim domain-containing protein [Bacteroidales bacterium]
MILTKNEINTLIQELKVELKAKLDGSEKNLIAQNCPYCGKAGKFGVYIGKETERKKLFSSNCFSCGKSHRDINSLLIDLGRPDLVFNQTADITSELETTTMFKLGDDEEEIDDELREIDLPEGYKRCFKNPYLKSRGFDFDDFDFFPCGTTRGCNFKFDDYIIFPIIDNDMVVGYVSRHTWSKDELNAHNKAAKKAGKYQLLRYRNSNDADNDFVKLLYNYDNVIEDETDTVIIVEGIFDVIALTRKMNLYDNSRIVPVATFGKKISNIQIYKLQAKGVRNVVLAYDSDAVETIKKVSKELEEFFDVLIADPAAGGKDMDEMSTMEVYDTFAYDLKTPREYILQKLQV